MSVSPVLTNFLSRRRPLAFAFGGALALGAALAAPLSLSSCGGGGGDDEENATLTATLSDSPSRDVTSFTVTINALTVTHAGGAVVDLIANPVEVDLTSLARASQVISIQSVAGGQYDHASITLDFTNSDCFLVDQTTAATLQDGDGNALVGTVTLPIDLTGAPVSVAGGGRMELDFDVDLDQSLTIDAVGNKVLVAPAVVVRPNRSQAHLNLAMGALKSVNLSSKTAVLDLQSRQGASLGLISVLFNNNTIFQVDGTPNFLNLGLGQLGGKPLNTWAQVFVSIDTTLGVDDLFYVEAGTGTWNGGQALIDGYLLDRSAGAGADATLTIRGMSSNAGHTVFQQNTDFTVTVSHAITRVVRDDSASTLFSTDALNIGQRLQVFGTLTGTNMDATGAGALVRAEPSPVLAFAAGAPAGTSLHVDFIRPAPPDGRIGPSSVDTLGAPFNWNHSAIGGRDPNDLLIEIGSLATGQGIVLDSPVSLDLYFSAVNDASPDATAIALRNLDAGVGTDEVFSLRDRAAGLVVATQTNATQVQFTVTGTIDPAETAQVDQGLLGVHDLLFTTDPVVMVGATQIQFTLQDETGGTVQSFSTYSAFLTALADALATPRAVKDFIAIGSFDAPTNVFSAKKATAIVK